MLINEQNSDIPYVSRLEDTYIDSFIAERTVNKDVLFVEGARQTGKTRLILEALSRSGKHSTRLSLERDARICALINECQDFKELESVLADYVGYSPREGNILFIDEAQESRMLGRFVRFMKEEWENTTVILSGSTLRRIFRSGTRYPVGRIRRLVLWPFSFTEYLRAHNRDDLASYLQEEAQEISTKRHDYLLTLYDRYLRTGGLPAVVQKEALDLDYAELRAQIIADYEQDFLRIFGEELIDVVRACFRSVANFVGGVSKNTSVVPSLSSRLNAKVNEIFARLEAWHLVLLSFQRGPLPYSSHAYLPKRYLFDTGVLRHIRESAVPTIDVVGKMDAQARTPLGGVLENQTAIELKRVGQELIGWKRTSSGNEIDFLVKAHDFILPIECKATLTINKRHMRGIIDYLRMYSLRTGYIVSFAPFSITELSNGLNVINVPAYMLDQFYSRGEHRID